VRTNIHKTVQLGELVVAAFDKAAQRSGDPREISRLATGAVMRILRRARKTSTRPTPPATCTEALAASMGVRS
jgi:hypothetical protein